jgi:ATP-binding cassette subfamily B (MDR/TAP) protein 1
VSVIPPCFLRRSSNKPSHSNFYVVPVDEMMEVNLQWIYKFFYFALGSLVANLMIGVGLSRSGNNLGKNLRNRAFSSMLERSMGWFDDSDHTTGELTTLLSKDVEAVQSLTGLPLGFRIRVLSSIVTGVCVALSFSWKIGLVAIACVPIIMSAGLLQVCCAKRQVKSNADGPSPPTIMEQGLRGIASVQAYNLESKVGDDYDRALMPESGDKVKAGLMEGFVFGFSQFAIFLSFALIFYVGAGMLVDMEIWFADFFTALLAVMFGALGASQVSADFNSRTKGRISAAK